MSSPCFRRHELATGARGPWQNHLLAALPPADYARLLPEMELVLLPVGRVVDDGSSGRSGYVYFPTDCVISVLCITKDGASAHIAATGCEGLVGTAQFLGGQATPYRSVVHCAGHAYRLESAVLNGEFERGGALRGIVLRYTLALISQVGQTAACNRLHSIEQQLCRLILSNLDRLHSNELTTTHQLLADSLGVRRECVTQAAGRLQRAGLIDIHRGQIAVPDRSKLEAQACECYGAIKKEYARLLSLEPLEAVPARRRPTFPFAAGRARVPPSEWASPGP